MAEALTIDLYLLRHAQTNLNLNRDIVGGRSNDAELSPVGPGQARRLGWQQRQAEIHPDVVFSSPAVRARETAAFCLQAMGHAGQEIIIDDRLQELDQGEWQGRSRAEVYTEAVITQIVAGGKDFRAPGGESVNDVAARMVAFADELPARFAGEEERKTVFAFGHGFAIRVLAGTLLDWSVDDMRRELTPNASASLFTYDDFGGWRVRNVGELVIAGV